MIKAKKTWVIVTNAETARLFDYPGRGKALVPLKDHVWHAPEMNHFADEQGVTHSSVGHSQHRLAPHNSPDRVPDAFAVQIGDNLSEALRAGAFEQLVVIAAPKMMGLLRHRLDKAVSATIQAEINKDFTHLPLDDLGVHLERNLPV